MKNRMLLLILCLSAMFVPAQEVSIDGNKFTMGGNEIWFNGINTPWHLFVDFGRSDFNYQWWEDEFARYADNNINLARVWIHCSGEVSPDIDETGYVSGASDLFWEHMDHLMSVAGSNGVYVMPALLSFDITKDGYSTFQRWRNWLQSPANIQSYIDNVLIPLVQRYDNEPYLLAWEICNEPEWMFENTEHGPQAFEDVQRMHAMLAAAVHENSSKFVTTGSAAPKWNSPIYDDWGDYEGNMFSDEALSSLIGNPNAYLDFYQYHWYPWQTEWMESPFTQTTAEYGVDDRPVIVGESEGNDVCDQYICQTVTEMYENAYQNGFDGVCAWKTPQNDGHGTFENIAVATNNFYLNHPNLVYPGGSEPVPVTGVDISDVTLTIETGETYQLTAMVLPADARDKRVSWTSANPTVASVTNSGLVTGVTTGTVTVTVTTSDGGFTASCNVTVEAGDGSGGDCSNPVALALPHTQQGEGEFCWVTSGNISYINSWNMEVVEINGVDFTNLYATNLPDRIGGNYFIYYRANVGWANLTIEGSGGDVDPDPDVYYDLSTQVNGSGMVSPSGGTYLENSQVTLTATPDPGWIFDGWSGDASGSQTSVTITMDSDKSVTAAFVEDDVPPSEYTLTVSTSGQGSVNPDGGTYLAGEQVTLTATPAAGWIFDGWSGDASGTASSITLVMDSDKTVQALFTEDDIPPVQYNLSVSVVGQGSVSPNGGTFEEGSTVILTASPASGWSLEGWSGDASGSNTTVSVTMDSDKAVTATFIQDTPPEGCDNPVSISIPFVQNGEGEFCWVTTTEIAYINSWNLDELTINGVDYTNTWSNSLPPAVNGEWVIHYVGPYPWSHFEAPQAKSATGITEDFTVKVYPNPFSESFTVNLTGSAKVIRVELVNSLGQIIESADPGQIPDANIRFDAARFGGTYILRIHTDDQVYTKQLFKL